MNRKKRFKQRNLCKIIYFVNLKFDVGEIIVYEEKGILWYSLIQNHNYWISYILLSLRCRIRSVLIYYYLHSIMEG